MEDATWRDADTKLHDNREGSEIDGYSMSEYYSPARKGDLTAIPIKPPPPPNLLLDVRSE